MLKFTKTTESNMGKKRRNFSSKFKAKVALEAIKERQSLSEPAQKHGLHPNQIRLWKKELQEGSSEIFETKRGTKSVYDKGKEARLFQQIGQLRFELDWLKKKHDQYS